MKEYKSTVFKVNFHEKDHTFLYDHEAIKACYDPNKFEKTVGFGFFHFNPTILKGNVPVQFLNDNEHEIRKAELMEYLLYINNTVSVNDIVQLVEEEFKQMPSFEELSLKKANKIDIASVVKVVTKVFLGDVIDPDKVLKWQAVMFEFQYGFKLSRTEEKRIADEIFKLVTEAPNILKLDKIIKSSKVEKEELIWQIIWMTMFNGAGATRNRTVSSLITFLQLSDTEKQNIAKESEDFLSSNIKDETTLSSLNTIHALFLEVCRLFTTAPNAYRKSKEKQIINSTSGRFELNKNDFVQGKVIGAQRDPDLFNDPNTISLRRDKELVEDNLYAFGGKFHETATSTNFKCPGQSLGMIILKIYIMHFSKCSIVPVSNLSYTGTTVGRLIASDKPLRVKTFAYRNDN